MQVNFTGNHKHADFSTSFNLRMNSDPGQPDSVVARDRARAFPVHESDFDLESSCPGIQGNRTRPSARIVYKVFNRHQYTFVASAPGP